MSSSFQKSFKQIKHSSQVCPALDILGEVSNPWALPTWRLSLQQASLLFDYPECGMFGLVMGFRRMKCPFSKGLFHFLFNYLTISWSKGSIASSEWVLIQKDERVVLLSFSKRTALSNSLNRNKIPGAEGQLPFLNESFKKKDYLQPQTQ